MKLTGSVPTPPPYPNGNPVGGTPQQKIHKQPEDMTNFGVRNYQPPAPAQEPSPPPTTNTLQSEFDKFRQNAGEDFESFTQNAIESLDNDIKSHKKQAENFGFNVQEEFKEFTAATEQENTQFKLDALNYAAQSIKDNETGYIAINNGQYIVTYDKNDKQFVCFKNGELVKNFDEQKMNQLFGYASGATDGESYDFCCHILKITKN